MIYLNLRVLVALLLVLILTILPLPEILTGYRPPFVLLLILYVQLYLPRYFNMFFLILIGLFLDVLSAGVLGEHTFALGLTTWIASTKTRRFDFFHLGQQMAYIIFFSLIYELMLLLIDAFLGYHYNILFIVVSSLLGMLIWPWFCILADGAFKVKRQPAFLT